MPVVRRTAVAGPLEPSAHGRTHSGRRSWRVSARRGAGALAVLAFATAPAVAQTRFAWPDTTVAVARYTDIEECVAAVARVERGYERRARRTVWRDTLPWDPAEMRAPLPAPVVETARQCAARFSPATTPLADVMLLARVLLVAGRDADAAALVARRLAAATGPNAALERAWVVDTVINLYLRAQPVRLAAAAALIESQGRPTRAALVERLADVYGQLWDAALAAGDTALAKSAASTALALVDSMPATERAKWDDKFGSALGVGIYVAMEIQAGFGAHLDSLRRSTAALVAYRRGLWARATGSSSRSMPIPIGEQAPPIADDFRFGAVAAGEPIPRRGRVSLIIFDISGNSPPLCAGQVDRTEICGPRHAILRRLEARFPALDIVTVTHTRGFFAYAKPPEPAEEAALIRQQFEALGHPGTVSITTTDFWRLPDPDRRRIDRDLPYAVDYSFGKSWIADPLSAVLVDQDGIIVHAGGIDRQSESTYAALIEVLLRRQAAGM